MASLRYTSPYEARGKAGDMALHDETRRTDVQAVFALVMFALVFATIGLDAYAFSTL